jgi:hypothetical protein
MGRKQVIIAPWSVSTGITGAGVLWHETVEEMIRRGFIHERDLPIPSGIEKKNVLSRHPPAIEEKSPTISKDRCTSLVSVTVTMIDEISLGSQVQSMSDSMI